MSHLNKFKTSFLIIAIIFLLGCSNNNERHIGEWKGTQKGEVGSLILDETNHAIFVIGNQVIGGDDFVGDDGKKFECKYEIDYSKNPIWLDIVIFEEGKTEENGRIKGIIRFVTDNKIEYRANFTGERFEKFDPDDKKNTLVLDRIPN